tara:strand:+ start:124230 stop:124463 length:234 start_codon:yes stop_codon:yes gene_type:complete
MTGSTSLISTVFSVLCLTYMTGKACWVPACIFLLSCCRSCPSIQGETGVGWIRMCSAHGWRKTAVRLRSLLPSAFLR